MNFICNLNFYMCKPIQFSTEILQVMEKPPMEKLTFTSFENFTCLLIPILFEFISLQVLPNAKRFKHGKNQSHYKSMGKIPEAFCARPGITPLVLSNRTNVRLFLVNCTTEEFMKTGLFLSSLILISSHWYTLKPFEFKPLISSPFRFIFGILSWQISYRVPETRGPTKTRPFC